MTAYYNENDRKAAAWLRELIKAGLIAEGEVDERSITDVEANDLTGFTQCHFFAGIGGWSYALRLAGWHDDKPVWTGSCPCQPFSVAGKGKGQADERHLWPVWFNLIAKCQPATIFGEQVAAAIGHGWLDGVFTDLEGKDYSCGAAVLPACGVGAPHIRQRLWWVAHADRNRTRAGEQRKTDSQRLAYRHDLEDSGRVSSICRLGDSQRLGLSGSDRRRAGSKFANTCSDSGLSDAAPSKEHFGRPGEVADAESREEGGDYAACACGGTAWEDYLLIPCADGKARRIKSGLEPLVNGLPGRVGLLRGYGNAIVPQLAAEFIKAAALCRAAIGGRN